MKEQCLFVTGTEGKRVWESGIILSRYIYYNRDQFKDKKILEVGSGTGIVGLALAKFTEAKEIILTDYQDEVLGLLNENINSN